MMVDDNEGLDMRYTTSSTATTTELKIKPRKFVKVDVDIAQNAYKLEELKNNKPYYRMNERW